VIEPNPVTIQLRYLQALSEISANQGSTIVFPLPLDMIRPLIGAGRTDAAEQEPATTEEPEPPRLEPGAGAGTAAPSPRRVMPTS
jgi:hypothetical protein